MPPKIPYPFGPYGHLTKDVRRTQEPHEVSSDDGGKASAEPLAKDRLDESPGAAIEELLLQTSQLKH
eukprot:865648-Amphidinium_carterae.1